MTDSFVPHDRPTAEFSAGCGLEAIADRNITAMFRRVTYGMAFLTLFLMAVGSATRVMNAGLACPDWPLCYGTLVPSEQMNLQVFLEWFHRLIATSMGMLAIGLVAASWWWRTKVPQWLPSMAAVALAIVVVQGILGGLTVTELLRFDIVTAHLGTGLLFFSTLLAIAVGLTPIASTPQSADANHRSIGRIAWLGVGATLFVYGQSLLGGLVASQWALHLCFGENELCTVMNAHLIGIAPASLGVVTLVAIVWWSQGVPTVLRRLSGLAGLCLGAQLGLGYATFRLHLQVEPLTVAHQAMGAALLGSVLTCTLVAMRLRQSAIAGDGDSGDGGSTDEMSANQPLSV